MRADHALKPKRELRFGKEILNRCAGTVSRGVLQKGVVAIDGHAPAGRELCLTGD
jgi:hypothetical protein